MTGLHRKPGRLGGLRNHRSLASQGRAYIHQETKATEAARQIVMQFCQEIAKEIRVADIRKKIHGLLYPFSAGPSVLAGQTVITALRNLYLFAMPPAAPERPRTAAVCM